ncbi:hypothetical protein HDV62DRAFT_357801, partial [Trichoderma sp. SZMC 28011]
MSSALCHGQLLVYLQASHLALSTWAASTSGRGTVASKGRPSSLFAHFAPTLCRSAASFLSPPFFLLVLAPNMQDGGGASILTALWRCCALWLAQPLWRIFFILISFIFMIFFQYVSLVSCS